MNNPLPKQALISSHCGPLLGTATIPGNALFAYTSLILATLAFGQSSLKDVPENEEWDVLVEALTELGAQITHKDDVWWVDGRGDTAFDEPLGVMDVKDNQRVLALLLGLLSTRNSTAFFSGSPLLNDFSLSSLLRPLEQMGAQFLTRSCERLPMGLRGALSSLPIVHRLFPEEREDEVPFLIAALGVHGPTTLIKNYVAQEWMPPLMSRFGAEVVIEKTADGAESITIIGKASLCAQNILVPTDTILASSILVAALIRPGSAVTLRSVLVSPRFQIFLDILKERGAPLVFSNRRLEEGGYRADLMIQGSPLCAGKIEASSLVQIPDEIPALVMAMACAEGTTCFQKITSALDRKSLELLEVGLKANGVAIERQGEDLIIYGGALPLRGGERVFIGGDVRLALAFLVLGMAALMPIEVEDAFLIEKMFPDFCGLTNRLGAKMETVTKV